MNHGNRPFILLILAVISLRGASAFAAAPTISAFAPASGVLYSSVTITGTNFALLSGYVAPRPDPMQLRPRKLR